MVYRKVGVFLSEPIVIRVRREFNFKKFLEILCENGAEALEIPEKLKLKQNEIKILKQLKKDYDLSYAIHSSSPGGYISLYLHPMKFYKRFKKCIEYTKIFDGEIITIDLDSYFAEPGVTYEEVKDYLFSLCVQNLRIAYKLGRENNIAVGFENGDVRDWAVSYYIKFNMTLDEMLEFVNAVPELKITLDIGHLYLASNYFGFDMFRYIKTFAKRIVHVHVDDNFGLDTGFGTKSRKYGDLHLPLDHGNLPWREVIKLLNNLGYEGIYSLEIKPYRISDNLNKMIDLIVESIKKLRNVLGK